MRSTSLLYHTLSIASILSTFAAAQTQLNPSKSSSGLDPNTCAFEPGARVSDACASYAYLNDLNNEISGDVRNIVVLTDFFSYYRLNLYNKVCPFWSDEGGLCGNIACAVTTLENEEDIPPIWRAAELGKLEGPKAHHPDRSQQRAHPVKPLHGELGENVGESCVVEYDDEWDERDYCVPEDESATANGDYVSLVDNPERFTGYAGEGAHHVWDAIYRENCFSRPMADQQPQTNTFGGFRGFAPLAGEQSQASRDLREVLKDYGRQQAMQTGSIEDQMEFDDQCVEKRIFYRVISGMHASISTHLCHDYLNQTTGEWGPNLECYKQRLKNYPERISNLYFNYALVLRAVGKLKDYIQDYTFCTGDPIEDSRTKQMVKTLASGLPGGPELFDESILFQDSPMVGSGVALKEDFRNRFRNISRIMDCVGCDKCRLWGKVQTAGYGTALKVLFEFGNNNESATKPLLRRTELVALMNTLDKISQAISHIQDFEEMVASGDTTPATNPDELDDDHVSGPPDATSQSDQKETDEEPSISDAFWEEWYEVWGVVGIVLGGWVRLPNTVWEIILSELARLWNYWLGMPVPPRSWEIKLPRGDEL